jgi:hypothetical protein
MPLFKFKAKATVKVEVTIVSANESQALEMLENNEGLTLTTDWASMKVLPKSAKLIKA